MEPISAALITCNEQDNIRDALESVRFCQEIVVVDSGSTDRTLEICRDFGARVLHRGWTGYVDQKNFAAGSALHDWIFSLDADERVSPALQAEIAETVKSGLRYAGYRMPRVAWFMGRWIRHGDWYPDCQLRLFDRRRGRWEGGNVHESVRVEGPAGALANEIHHYTYRSLSDYLRRLEKYSTLAASDLRRRGKQSGPLKMWGHPFVTFAKAYVLKKGFLDGVPGLMVAIMGAVSVFFKYAKLYESRTATAAPARSGAVGSRPPLCYSSGFRGKEGELMKGIVLAGGLGSRLYPLTKVTNKHLLPIYNKPMIYYPIESLVQAGIREILLVTGGKNAGEFLRLLGNGKQFGLNHINYTYQEGEGGIAAALSLAEFFADNGPVCVILGDNLIEGTIAPYVENFRKQPIGARILLKEVDDPQRFGVPEIRENRIVRIEEKPAVPASSYAVTGIYMYDETVFDIVRQLRPSARGELEITDVNNAYIEKNAMAFDVLEGWWTDAGTFESLLRASNLVARKDAAGGRGEGQPKSNYCSSV